MIKTKINIGCGYDHRADYLNIDSDPDCKPDILIIDNDLSGLPQGHFELAIALDVLEHIPRIHMMSALYDWVELLRPDGTLFVETSYIYGIVDIMRRANDFETNHNWKRCLFGNQVHPGDWHCNGFTVPTLTTYLRAVGLTVERVNIRDEWLIQVWARKTEHWKDLESIADYSEFLDQAFNRLVGRDPELFRLKGFTEANSFDRRSEIRSLVCSEERLYKIGLAILDLPITKSVGPPII